MDKRIDLGKSVYDICREYPEVTEIMKELGFDNITNPAMLNTVGRYMTIPKGAAMKGVSLDKIKEVFVEKGFEISQ